MKRFLLCALALAALVPFCSGAADKDSPVLLRYNLTPDQTNAYAVEVEVQGEGGKEIVAGKLTLASRLVGTNFFGLTLRGRLSPKFTPGSMPPFFRPSGPVPLSSLFTGVPMDTRELVIDARGEIVRQAADQSLPIPLGQLLASLFPQLPQEPTREWTTDETVFLLDEPLLLGPATVFQSPGPSPYMGFYPGRPPQGAIAARQRTSFKITETGAKSITLTRTLALDSRLLTGQEPRISASGEGQVVLDRATGWPKRVELQGKSVVATENLSRRARVLLRWTLLEGAEKEAALAPPPPKPAEATALSVIDLDKLVLRLDLPETAERQAAARELSASRLDEVPPRILIALSAYAADSDDTVRRAVLAVLAAKGEKEQVPVLIKGLNDADSNTRNSLIKGLGRLKDPRAAEPLAQLIASGQTDPFYHSHSDVPATEALMRLGPAAEPAALSLLKEKHIDTLFQACAVLKQIGTKKSLNPLKELTTHPNKELGDAAADACRAIQARMTP